MRTLACGLLVISTLCLSGCLVPGVPGSGVIVAQPRSVSAFQSVSLEGGADITIEASASETSCELEVDDNLQELIETRVENGVLIIRPTENIAPTKSMVVRIKTPTLEGLTIAGSADVTITNLQQTNFALTLSGSGDVNVAGASEEASYTIQGSGSIAASDLKTQSTSITINGSGEALLNVEKELAVRINGSGTVRYRGAAEVSEQIFGSGSVERLAE